MRYTEQSTHVEGTRGQPEDKVVLVERSSVVAVVGVHFHAERVEVEAYQTSC